MSEVREDPQGIEYELIPHLEGMDLHVFLVAIHRRRIHYHSDCELFIPLKGEVSVSSGGRACHVGEGDFFFVNAYEAHSLSALDAPNALLVIQFSHGFCRSYYPSLSRLCVDEPLIARDGNPALHRELLSRTASLIRILDRREAGYPLRLMGELNHLSAALVRRFCEGQPVLPSPARAERARLRMMSVSAYVQEHYAGKPSLEELARREGLQLSYLSRFIRKAFGLSFRDYVTRLRLEHAARLAATTDMRLIDICVESGFSDTRYLNRAFRDAFGMSPQAFREAAVGQPQPRPWESSGPGSGKEHDVKGIGAVSAYVLERLAAMQEEDSDKAK